MPIDSRPAAAALIAVHPGGVLVAIEGVRGVAGSEQSGGVWTRTVEQESVVCELETAALADQLMFHEVYSGEWMASDDGLRSDNGGRKGEIAISFFEALLSKQIASTLNFLNLSRGE